MSAELMSPEDRLKKLDIHLPEAPTPFGAYVESLSTGNLVFLSGMLATSGHKVAMTGIVGKSLDVKGGQAAARIAAMNALALMKKHLGSLDRVKRIIRLGVSIAATAEFTEHPQVADGASVLLRDVLGEERLPTRLIIGVASLPLGSPVALEIILEATH